MAKRTRVLLADDHRLLADALKSILEPKYEVVGTVGDGRALLEAAEKLRPDVIVVDIASSDGTGEYMAAEWPGARVIRLARNDGPSPGRNVGIKTAASRFVLLMDADVCIAPHTVAMNIGADNQVPSPRLCCSACVRNWPFAAMQCMSAFAVPDKADIDPTANQPRYMSTGARRAVLPCLPPRPLSMHAAKGSVRFVVAVDGGVAADDAAARTAFGTCRKGTVRGRESVRITP